MRDQKLEEKLQSVLGQKECPVRLQKTIDQCMRITREQRSLQPEERTGFWQYLSDVLRFEGMHILGLHAVILLLACAAVWSAVDILRIPAFMPLFVLAVMPVFLRSRYYGMSEIEAVTRASGVQIILAKLLLAGAANLVSITIVLSLGVSAQSAYENIGRLVLYCLVPYLVCMSALLRIVRLSPRGSTLAYAVSMTGAGVCWGIFAGTKTWIYETSAMGFWIAAFLLFFAFFVREICFIIGSRREGKLYGIID